MESKRTTGTTKGSMAKMEAALNKMKEKNQQQRKHIAELEDIQKRQAKEIEVLNRALEERFDGDEDSERLVYEVNTLRIESDDIAMAFQSQSEKLASVERVLTETLETNKELENRNDTMGRKLEEKLAKVVELEEKYQLVESERNDAVQERETLLQVIEERTQDLNNLRGENQRLKEDSSQSKEEIQQLKQQLTKSNSDLMITTERYNNIAQVLSSKDGQLSEEMNARIFYQQMEGDLKTRLQFAETRYSEVFQQLDVFNKLNFELQEKISELEAEKEMMNEEVEKSNKLTNSLREELDHIESRRDIIESEIRGDLDRALVDLEESKSQNSEYSQKNRELEKKMEELSEMFQTLESDHQNLHEKYKKIDESKKLMQQTLMDQLNSERKVVKERDQTIEQLNSQIVSLNEEITNLKESLSTQQRARQIAKSKRKILKSITTKQKQLEVLNDSNCPDTSMIENKENSFLSSCNTSIISDTGYHSINKSLSKTQPVQMNSLNTSFLSPNLQGSMILNSSLNSSILYPAPQPMNATNLSYYSSRSYLPVSNATQNGKYVSSNGHPMNLFELAKIQPGSHLK